MGYEVTAGNVHDSIAFDAAYGKVKEKFPEVKTITMDSACRTPWICKRVFGDGRNASLPYKCPMTKDGFFRKYEYIYDDGHSWDFSVHGLGALDFRTALFLSLYRTGGKAGYEIALEPNINEDNRNHCKASHGKYIPPVRTAVLLKKSRYGDGQRSDIITSQYGLGPA